MKNKLAVELDECSNAAECLNMTKTFSTRIRPEDEQMLNLSAARQGISKNQLYGRCLDHAVLIAPEPRSTQYLPCKKLLEIAIVANTIRIEKWRAAAFRRKMPFHFWLRECAIPFAALDYVPVVDDGQEDNEIADPVWPNYCARQANERSTLTLRLKDGKRRNYQIAARSQKLSVNSWILSVLDQAAPYHIKNPKA